MKHHTSHRRPTRLTAVAIPAIAGLLLAGCVGDGTGDDPSDPIAPGGDGTSGEETTEPDETTPDDGEDGTGSDDGAAPGDDDLDGALALIGLWRVSGAEGEDDDVYLRIDATEMMVWRSCGVDFASWRAGDGLLLIGQVEAYVGDCHDSGSLPFDLPWLTAATAVETTAGGVQLLDAAGEVTATLTEDGRPEPHPDVSDDLISPPEVTDHARELLGAHAPLGDGLVPPTPEELVGRWVPVEEAETEPYADFGSDGSWEGSDGCNGASGRWAVGADGTFLSTSGPMTQMWCEGADVPQELWQARTVALDSGVLTFFDVGGAEVLQLQRDEA